MSGRDLMGQGTPTPFYLSGVAQSRFLSPVVSDQPAACHGFWIVPIQCRSDRPPAHAICRVSVIITGDAAPSFHTNNFVIVPPNLPRSVRRFRLRHAGLIE